MKDIDLSYIPNATGVYKFFAIDGGLLYVGKSINLKARVSSYFSSTHPLSPRIKFMVSQIKKVEYLLTPDEHSALLLEIELIKNECPRYNIIFRDDKTYPFIRFTKHEFSCIKYQRGHIKKDDYYFGPYTDARVTKKYIRLIQKIFQLRVCSDFTFKSRKTPCILYQLKRCSAPCVGYIRKKEYILQVKMATQFLTGKLDYVVSQLTKQMHTYADQLNFEQARILRDEINLLHNSQTSKVVRINGVLFHSNLVNIIIDDDSLHIYITSFYKGVKLPSNYYRILKNNDIMHSIELFLEKAIIDKLFNSSDIFIDCKVSEDFTNYCYDVFGIRVKVKSKNKLINILLENEKIAFVKLTSKENEYNKSLAYLSRFFSTDIKVIESIDISHHHGDDTVAAIIVFQQHKIDYKQSITLNLGKYNGDDLKALADAYTYRLKMFPNMELPDLLVVDGGPLQRKSIIKIIKQYNLCGKISVLSILKGENRNPKFDTIIYDSHLGCFNYLEASKMLQYIRDETHNLGVCAHRKSYINRVLDNELLTIKGVGQKKAKLLIEHFGSIDNIKLASFEQLVAVNGIGTKLSKLVYFYFHSIG